jgi:hypothetical protein
MACSTRFRLADALDAHLATPLGGVLRHGGGLVVDDDDGALDARRGQVIEHVVQEGTARDREERFRDGRREGSHAFAEPGGENDGVHFDDWTLCGGFSGCEVKVKASG